MNRAELLAMDDAALWGDEGSNTLATIRRHPEFDCPNLERLGLLHINGSSGADHSTNAIYKIADGVLIVRLSLLPLSD